MKKFLIFLITVLSAVCVCVLSACQFKKTGITNKKLDSMTIGTFYGGERCSITLPISHWQLDQTDNYLKLRTTADKDVLFSQLKDNDSLVKEYGDSLLFICDTLNNSVEKCECPQYVALSYIGVYEKDTKYSEYIIEQQIVDFHLYDVGIGTNFVFPKFFTAEKHDLKFTDENTSVNVNCTFEQFIDFYRGLDYCLVSASGNSLTVKGTGERRIKLEYSDGKITVSFVNE